MENILEKMRENALRKIDNQINWHKESIESSKEDILSNLMGNGPAKFPMGSQFRGLAMLKLALVELEEFRIQLLAPVAEPVKAKRKK